MRKTLISATLGSLVLALAITTGCQDTPHTTRVVDQSVLPASAKAMFGQDAQITKVEEVSYSKGAKEYKVYYTVDGKRKTVLLSNADETRPTGVFEHAAY